MGHSLSKESQVVLKAALKGDADLLEHYLATDPALIKSVTLLKRSSILHLAAREGYPDIIIACLQPYIAAVRSEISTDAYPGPACQKLRKVINSRDVYYRTPLIVAAKKGQLECVRAVVERAANLFAIDRDANTCLHYAALHGHVHVVEYLIHKTRSRETGPGGRDLLER
jgi:ankyrin repeat protein